MRGINWWLVAGATLLIVDVGAWAMIVRANAVFIPPAADFIAYRDAAASWLAGTGFYHPYQLAGAYTILAQPEPILYPPVILWLLVPFTVLPAALWWTPVAIVAWVVARSSRERQFMALALALWPQTIGMVVVGNPGMWIVAALAMATVHPVFAPFVLVKPTLAPFALYRSTERWWWVGLGLFGLLGLPFGAMWLDWIHATLNSDANIFYSLSNVAPMLIPLVADQTLVIRMKPGMAFVAPPAPAAAMDVPDEVEPRME